MNNAGKMNGVANNFLHGTRHSRGVCILIGPSVKNFKFVYSHCDLSGRLILINLTVDCLELSL